MAEDADNAPGWHAIDNALTPIYGDTEPLHMGTVVPYALGGPDPIHGISAYSVAGPTPHWHFVTYGFSELWQKESKDPDVSGYGFELTFRLARKPRDKKPPNWAFNFLQNVGRYVFQTGNVFGQGHTMPLNGPIEVGSKTQIQVISFLHDPQLPPIRTPNGGVEFLQVVGLTLDEMEAISSWNATAFLQLRAKTDPLLITDTKRTSWLDDVSFARRVRSRTNKEGSSCGWLMLVLKCKTKKQPIEVHVQTIAVEGLSKRLLGRLLFGRDLVLHGKDAEVMFKPGKRSGVRLVKKAVHITLTEDHLRELTEMLEPHAGVHAVPGIKNLQLHVLRTEITDPDGKVVKVVE